VIKNSEEIEDVIEELAQEAAKGNINREEAGRFVVANFHVKRTQSK
jgi:hypothetical protein